MQNTPEYQSDFEVWYIALAQRQAWCCVDCFRERERERERDRDLKVRYIALAHRQVWCVADCLVYLGS